MVPQTALHGKEDPVLETTYFNQKDCGQNPRLFLKEEKGFGKVHQGREAEGSRSLHQVLQATKVIKELGECGRFLGLFFQVASGNNERKEYYC